jgi:hypothetical protein
MGRVTFETRPSPQSIPWSREEEAEVADLVRDCLRDTDGSWEVVLTFSGVLAHNWVVDCRRNGDGRGLQLLLDPRLPADVASFRTALESLAAAPVRPGRKRSRSSPRPGAGE